MRTSEICNRKMVKYRNPILDEIRRKINSKGWNLYGIKDDENLRVAVPRGPAESLEVERQYLTAPRVQNPRDAEQVMNAINKMNERKNYPVILSAIPMGLLIIKDESIVVRAHSNYRFTYSDFSQALETLVACQTD